MRGVVTSAETTVVGGSISPAPARLAWIEALRGVAAVAVVLYHVSRHFDANYGTPLVRAMFQFGHAGVDLFFVISGFIILFVHASDIGRSEQIGRYSVRRLTRVLPIYWIALLVTVTRRWAGGHGTAFSELAWAIVPVPTWTEPVLGVAWTLQYELVFYVAFGVMILHRWIGTAVMAIWLSVILIAAVRGGRIDLPEAYWGIYGLEFFGGMVVAHGVLHGGLGHYKIVLAAGVVGFALSGVAEDLGWMDGYGTLARLAYGGPAMLVVLGCALASRCGGVRVPVVLRELGAASYSVYLFHLFLIGLMWQVWRMSSLEAVVPPAIGFVLFVPGAMVLSVLISRLVEYPLMRLSRGALNRLRLSGSSKGAVMSGRDLAGRVALVTGASRGIGAAIALALAAAGAHVAVNYRERRVEAESVADAVVAAGSRAITVAADVSDGQAVVAMVGAVTDALGAPDILVNNAGIALIRGIDDLTEADFDQTIAVNLKSVFLCTQAVLPAMRARGWGRIVNISSGAARGAGGVGLHYNASKAGMEGLTRGYAARLVKQGITVNAVAPSLIETDMVRSGVASSPSRIPLGRFGTSVLNLKSAVARGSQFPATGSLFPVACSFPTSVA